VLQTLKLVSKVRSLIVFALVELNNTSLLDTIFRTIDTNRLDSLNTTFLIKIRSILILSLRPYIRMKINNQYILYLLKQDGFYIPGLSELIIRT